MRLIDGDKFLNYIKEIGKEAEDQFGNTRRLISIDLKRVEELIEKQPTVEGKPQGKWIPASEKLPEKFKEVLCWAKSTARGGDICFVGSCANGCWFLQSSAGYQSYPTQYEVVAWMELPEPYKKVEE